MVKFILCLQMQKLFPRLITIGVIFMLIVYQQKGVIHTQKLLLLVLLVGREQLIELGFVPLSNQQDSVNC